MARTCSRTATRSLLVAVREKMTTASVKRILEAEVHGRRNRGRQINTISH